MSGNKDGNIFGIKPVVGSKQDNISGNTAMSLLKKLVNKLGLGAFSYGFDGGFDIYSDEVTRSVQITGRHFHNNVKFFGLAGTPSGETHRADRLTLLPEPFVVDAGNNTWGSWLQILGSSDTPILSTHQYYDFDRFTLVANERTSTVHGIQIAYGESGELPGKLAAEDFTEDVIKTPAVGAESVGPIMLKITRFPAGSKLWIRIWSKGQNTGTLSLYPAFHGYIY